MKRRGDPVVALVWWFMLSGILASWGFAGLALVSVVDWVRG